MERGDRRRLATLKSRSNRNSFSTDVKSRTKASKIVEVGISCASYSAAMISMPEAKKASF